MSEINASIQAQRLETGQKRILNEKLFLSQQSYSPVNISIDDRRTLSVLTPQSPMIKYNLNLSPPFKHKKYNLHTMHTGKNIQGW